MRIVTQGLLFWLLLVSFAGARTIYLQGSPVDTNGLVSLWEFQEGGGTIAYDSVGNNDGTVYGASWTSGMIGGALSFDGLDDYIDVGNDSSLKSALPVTLSAWIRLSCSGSTQYIIALDDQTSKYYGIWWYLRSGGDLVISYGDGDYPAPDSRRSKVGTTALETYAWYHLVAVVRGASDMSLYVNGVDDGGTYSGTGGSLAYSSASSLIGKKHDSAYAFYGKIDDVRVYERALSTEEILEAYQTGLPEHPCIDVWPEALEYYGHEGGSNPASQIISIRNMGIGELDYLITEDCSWLEADPGSGTSVGETDEITLSVDISGLTWGTHDCILGISDPCAFNNPQLVTVTLQVRTEGPLYVPWEYATIQAAIDDCNDGDVVIVASGTYTGPGNRDIDFLGKAITVRSEDGPESCIIDCDGSYADRHRGFCFRSNEEANSVLTGFTIKRGDADCGGAIVCRYSNPVITDCRFLENYAEYEGWQFPDTGFGGAMYCWYSSPTITNCTFSGNFAEHRGGGMYNVNSSPKLTNCTFSGNSTRNQGGAMCNSFSSHPTLTNCTIVGNTTWRTSGGAGGGISNPYYTCKPKLTNCIIWGNEDSGGMDESAQVFHGRPVISYCCIQGWTGTLGGAGNIDSDPCLVAVADGDYRLLPDSPCIDAGDNDSVPADTADLDGDGNTTEPIPWDLDGNPRIVDGNNDGNAVVDMGAYENFVLPIEVAMQFTPQALNPGSGGKWVKAHFVLPEGYTVSDVDVNSPAKITEPFEPDIDSNYVDVFINDDNLVEVEATFERGVFCEADIGDEAIEVTAVGSFTSGQQFYGTDTIKVTTNYFKHMGILASHWLEPECDKPDWCEGADLDQDCGVDFVDLALFDGCVIEVVR